MLPARHLLAWLPMVALAACATQPAPNLSQNTTVPTAGQSAYGLFLAGQSAMNAGDGDLATALFTSAARAADASDVTLLDSHAFTAALLAGNVTQASAFMPAPGEGAAIRHLAGLTKAVEDMSDGRPRKARAILVGGHAGAPYTDAAALLAPFAAAQSGDYEAAIGLPVIAGDPVAAFFANLDQGKLFEHAHRYDEAETAFRSLIERGDPGGIASANLGAFLERRGRWSDALATYDQALAHSPGDPVLLDGRERALSRRGAPSLPSLRQSAAEALIAPASVFIVQRQEEQALAYLRLALRLDPTHDSAWLLVGDVLTDVGDVKGARAAYLAPKPGSRDYVAARAKLAWSYQGDGDKDQALTIARATLAASPGSREAATTLADLLRADDLYDESVGVLDKLITSDGANPDWRLLYMRAVDYQESNRWPLAEDDLKAALKLHPDEPELLNFLGYSWIDRGIRLHEALAMVQKAVDYDPKSGAMLDSLGWGYYRLGDYKKAVDKLEQAVAIEAGDPDVNNHLGDAYWRAGRTIEARFQWNRVLSLEPAPKLKAEVEIKLKDGLGAVPPVSGS